MVEASPENRLSMAAFASWGERAATSGVVAVLGASWRAGWAAGLEAESVMQRCAVHVGAKRVGGAMRVKVDGRSRSSPKAREAIVSEIVV